MRFPVMCLPPFLWPLDGEQGRDKLNQAPVGSDSFPNFLPVENCRPSVAMGDVDAPESRDGADVHRA